ncbi:hypothetical protein B9Z19DRAFT_1069918 [Tuber borchii]|uniref:Uncharacterized protein n=1 Tax=Tuber borchii TaxID=42251 RepID=A0A2T6Z9Y0_TUBBO|nr:hypothetical protein B9Z19DRAFT_1069918 [Tuber borchii]
MSMDAGGLAQINYFHQQANPTSFASRGKGSHLRNISVPVPSNNLSAPADNQTATTPRTARSALLAGLRTAPRTPNPSPASASLTDSGLESKYSSPGSSGFVPQNTRSGQSPNRYRGYQSSQGTPYSAASQQLPTPPSSSSPALGLNGEMFELSDETDNEKYQQLLATNFILAQKQAELQAQLANSVAAHQVQLLQLQQLQLQSSGSSNFATPPMSPGGLGSYMQQSANAANMNANRYYPIYNNIYGYYAQPQVSVDYLQQFQQQQQQSPPASAQPENNAPVYQPPQQQQQQQQQTQSQERQSPTLNASTGRSGRSRSPPKLTLNQPTNSSGFKRGHRKASSLSTCVNVSNLDIAEPPKTSLPKIMPTTPMTATFAPGHASGSHPIRQPRGPPAFEELKAKPTNKDGGSKNFATRQRRRAVFKLVTAGMERRTARSASSSIGGTMTPVSENEGFGFEDAESVSSSLSGRASRTSIRGGESPQDYSASSVSGDEGVSVKQTGSKESGGLKAPRLVFSSATKRNSAQF